MKQMIVAVSLLFSLGVHAQLSNVKSVRTSENYRPEGRAFVCVNGHNRYTRALYGSPTEWRVETSDRPVFALYKKNDCRNLQFRVNGIWLDQTDFCEARYEDGMRSYLLRHKAWGPKATLRVKVVASLQQEQALWRFLTTGFTGDVKLEVFVSNIRKPKLSRNGDLGADPKDAFEADGKETVQQWSQTFEDEYYVCCNGIATTTTDARDASEHFDEMEAAMKELAGRVEFNTPDPYVNTLGGALVVAADGDWDGKTWLHGCIGWRMPLAGWRAGYLGDVLGWPNRAMSHFDAYAKSQVNNVPPKYGHPTQDAQQNMARARKEWGTQMYSNGYICRNPERNDQMHHYDMNLNYIDELLWHFQYDADKTYMRKMWPVLKSHLAWEKRNFDPDGDHLYDAYCCIWASDALYYSGGAVTHSSAYNYRANLLAARIAKLIGEDGTPYQQEAEAILKAMNQRLWLNDKGHWAEYQDLMGLKRVHESAAVWSIYAPIDCGACTPEQAYRATKYVDKEIPHIPLTSDLSPLTSDLSPLTSHLSTIATSNWLPYSWSINNVAAAEVMHTALAYFEAGRSEEGYQLMMANILDQMYYGQSPANFGQISKYDAARGECYRDFGDCIGISARTLLQGLFGILPNALEGRCIIRPGFPEAWDSASVRTPYIYYKYQRQGDEAVYEVTQHFAQPQLIVIRQNLGMGKYRDVVGTNEQHQVIRVQVPVKYPEVTFAGYGITEQRNIGTDEPTFAEKFHKQNIDRVLNDSVTNIFSNAYRTPRPPYTTLQIPLQGVGDWCHPAYKPEINDSLFRSLIVKDEFVAMGVPFRTSATGRNIAFTSLWDNYPDSISIPLSGRYQQAWLLMAGTTNHMQCRIANGMVVAQYTDGTADTLQLVNPDNWCPIERDYYVDGKAFQTAEPRPYRVAFAYDKVSRNLSKALGLPFANPQGGEIGPKGADGGEIKGGAATMLRMPLNRRKRLQSLTVRTLSNDVVIGLMAVTLQ
ncbi:MAG: DUF4450 domain-containing protein [Prevotella sp.]|nr:DUF4450 domain-containing protein [Prevotella sp.]